MESNIWGNNWLLPMCILLLFMGILFPEKIVKLSKMISYQSYNIMTACIWRKKSLIYVS